jgi:hypothetical protein
MVQVVLDSNNLDAIVADATGKGLAPEMAMDTISGAAIEARRKIIEEHGLDPKDDPVLSKLDKPAADATGSTEKTAAPATEAGKTEDPDDIEGDDGLTPRQKREFTKQMQATIAKKHRQRLESEEFATEQYNERRLAEQRADALQEEIERLKTQFIPPIKALEAKEPKREDFKTDQEYEDARIDWRADQRIKERDAAAAKETEAARVAQVMADAKARIDKAKELVPDFEEVTGAIETVVPPVIAGYMQESEMFAELGYHFAKHPEVLERLTRMPPAKALVEVGKIESTLQPFAPADDGTQATKATNGSAPSKPSTETGKSTETAPSKPRAAAPIRPLPSGSGTQVEKPAHQRTYAEERAAFQKRHGVNLGRRQRH